MTAQKERFLWDFVGCSGFLASLVPGASMLAGLSDDLHEWALERATRECVKIAQPGYVNALGADSVLASAVAGSPLEGAGV